MNHKSRLAIVSPFLGKSQGTERIIVEWMSQLAGKFDIHVYSQCIEDVDRSRITWHRIPKLPGPHLINFLWWFVANHFWRAWDHRVRGLRHDIVFSPGCNCLDADAVSVHIVFAEYARKLEAELRLARQPISLWPRLLHRKLYYQLAVLLERRVYTRSDISLILIAQRTLAELERFYGRRQGYAIVYLGLDHDVFNPGRRAALRREARRALGLSPDQFAVLVIGNDWRNKGIPALFEALARLQDLPIALIVVSKEDLAPLRAVAAEKSMDSRLRIFPPRKDVEYYYAAADVYAGPSLEDTFALPPAEAMACGLPVIVSEANGTSEIITHGMDGLVLSDPRDASTLASMLRSLYENRRLGKQLGKRATEKAQQFTWERNGRELAAIFEEVLRRKSRVVEQTVTQEL